MQPYVTQILKCYEQGVTFPFLCKLSDTRLAVVKYPRNTLGSYVLINEYIAYRIAKRLNLTISDCGYCDFPATCALTDKFRDQWYESPDLFSDTDDIGVSFYSEFIPKTVPPNSSLVSLLENKQEFIKLVLFDHIIFNVDRHEGNLLVTIGPAGKFFIIDHSNIFCCNHQWTAKELQQRIEQNDYNSNELLQESANNEIYNLFWPCCQYTMEAILQTAKEMQTMLPPDFIHAMIEDIPKEWRAYISVDDWSAMEKYLNYRIEHLENIANVIARERGMI